MGGGRVYTSSTCLRLSQLQSVSGDEVTSRGSILYSGCVSVRLSRLMRDGRGRPAVPLPPPVNTPLIKTRKKVNADAARDD